MPTPASPEGEGILALARSTYQIDTGSRVVVGGMGVEGMLRRKSGQLPSVLVKPSEEGRNWRVAENLRPDVRKANDTGEA